MSSNSEKQAIREYSNHVGARTPSDSVLSRPKHQHAKQRLTFLRHENLLSQAHNNYIPPTAQQIRDLAIWAGLNGGGRLGIEKLAKAAQINESQMWRWVNTKKPIDECPVIPGPVWRYLLIRLGVIEQPEFRRVEPQTFVKESFTPENQHELTLRAKIWYEPTAFVIDFYNDSIGSASRKDDSPIFSITLNHDKSEFGNTINGYQRHDDLDSREWPELFAPLSKAHEAKRVRQHEIDYYFTFFNKNVVPALWRLHDYHSISPRDFLKNVNLNPFKCKDDELPDHRSLLSFCHWAGVKRSDLAHICGETVGRLSYLSSGRGESNIKEIQERFNEGKASHKDVNQVKWANKISRHAWALMLSAYGLSPSIPVIGRSSPNPKKTRTFELKVTHGVPTEFVKIETQVCFSDPALTKITLIGRVNTQSGLGEEWQESFKVTKNLDGELFVDGALIGKNTESPDSWKAMNERHEIPEVAHSYINKAVWHHIGQFIQFYYSN